MQLVDPDSFAASTATIDQYLALCEERNLKAASAHLAPDALLVWPGGTRHESLQDMVESASGRYRWVRKHRGEYAVGADAEGRTVVTSRGSLYGVNLHGVEFDGIRYVDVFVLEAGRIIEQHVWNDLGVVDALTRTEAPRA